MNKELNEAAEKYAKKWGYQSATISTYISACLSDAAKQYWYAQWELEQKQVITDEEIEKLAEKTREIVNKTDYVCSGDGEKNAFDVGYFLGFKAALQMAQTPTDNLFTAQQEALKAIMAWVPRLK